MQQFSMNNELEEIEKKYTQQFAFHVFSTRARAVLRNG